ncbi:MAG TPA: radical SAM protein, partial [Methanomassiliicoccales archaeon]|nr:radical SAM protein [Methanomassiliicoccales archaeon]
MSSLRVALINTGFEEGEKGIMVSPPLGIMSIGACLRANGFEVRLFDWSNEPLDDAKERDLGGFAPDLVGLTVIMGSSIVRSKKASSWAKGMGSKVVWGGPFPSILGELSLRQAPVDYLVVGEGEGTMLELCQALREGAPLSGIKGLAHLDGDKMRLEVRPRIRDLDSLPMPWWEGAGPLGKYLIPFYGREAIPMVSSRGCPNTCSFCYTKAMWGYRWTSRSAAKVVDEIQLVQHLEPRISAVIFDDDLFAGDVERVLEFCKELKERGMDIAWNCELRARDIKEPLVTAMKDAGCVELLIGVETGSDRLLSSILKGVGRKEIAEAFRIAHKAGLRCNAMLMVGIPGETIEDFRQTEALLKGLDADGYYFSLYLPSPGTAMFQLAKEHGFKEPSTLEEWADHYGYDVSQYPRVSMSEVPFDKV